MQRNKRAQPADAVLVSSRSTDMQNNILGITKPTLPGAGPRRAVQWSEGFIEVVVHDRDALRWNLELPHETVSRVPGSANQVIHAEKLAYALPYQRLSPAWKRPEREFPTTG